MPAKPRKPEPTSLASDSEGQDAEASVHLDLGTLKGHLGYFVRRLQVEIFQDFIRALAPFDVRPAQYSVLVLVAANPGQPQAVIGRALNIERAALAKMLHDMERRGWVERLPSLKDGRSYALFLTGDGGKVFARIRSLALAHERRLEGRIGTRRHQELMTLLKEFG